MLRAYMGKHCLSSKLTYPSFVHFFFLHFILTFLHPLTRFLCPTHHVVDSPFIYLLFLVLLLLLSKTEKHCLQRLTPSHTLPRVTSPKISSKLNFFFLLNEYDTLLSYLSFWYFAWLPSHQTLTVHSFSFPYIHRSIKLRLSSLRLVLKIRASEKMRNRIAFV